METYITALLILSGFGLWVGGYLIGLAQGKRKGIQEGLNANIGKVYEVHESGHSYPTAPTPPHPDTDTGVRYREGGL